MSLSQRYAIGWLAALTATACWLPGQSPALIEGTVRDERGPIAGARVGWQGQCERVITDARGHFPLLPSAWPLRLVASKAGYRIASSDRANSLTLQRLPSKDNQEYAWIDPRPDPARPNNCANCHAEIYREWQGSAHARSATNPKFLQLFAGIAETEYSERSAVCATCHAPTLSSPTLEYDIREADGVAKSGVHCDYCHKVADAPTDKLGIRFGRDGLHLLRPANGDLLTFGPLDDAVRKGESFGCLPLYKESRYCASCHEGIVFGVHAYGTYSEWLDSPAKKTGQECQDCHMAPTGKMTNIAPGHGGIQRDPKTLASHHLPGGPELIRRAVTLKAQTKVVPNGRQVEIEIVAQHVGHRVPTGFVDRHLILVVHAVDANGRPVDLLEGERLPTSAGKWQGKAGMLYAKQLLGDADQTPLSFWLHIAKTVDTRLLPEQPDRRTFVFDASVRRINVQVWYRRFWQEVAEARGWNDNELLIAERRLGMP
jgi:nitrate/TMAO reductase-like tetraheme cytochrome c subunit